MVSSVAPLPQASLSAMANTPVPPVKFARPPGLVLVHSEGPVHPVLVLVTVQPAGGNVPAKSLKASATSLKPGPQWVGTFTVAEAESEALLPPSWPVQVALLVTVSLTTAGDRQTSGDGVDGLAGIQREGEAREDRTELRRRQGRGSSADSGPCSLPCSSSNTVVPGATVISVSVAHTDGSSPTVLVRLRHVGRRRRTADFETPGVQRSAIGVQVVGDRKRPRSGRVLAVEGGEPRGPELLEPVDDVGDDRVRARSEARRCRRGRCPCRAGSWRRCPWNSSALVCALRAISDIVEVRHVGRA